MTHHVLSIDQDFEGGLATASLALGTLYRRAVNRGDITLERAEALMEEFATITTQLVEGATVNVQS